MERNLHELAACGDPAFLRRVIGCTCKRDSMVASVRGVESQIFRVADVTGPRIRDGKVQCARAGARQPEMHQCEIGQLDAVSIGRTAR